MRPITFVLDTTFVPLIHSRILMSKISKGSQPSKEGKYTTSNESTYKTYTSKDSVTQRGERP